VVAPEGGDDPRGVVLADTWRIILDIVENMEDVGTPRWSLLPLWVALLEGGLLEVAMAPRRVVRAEMGLPAIEVFAVSLLEEEEEEEVASICLMVGVFEGEVEGDGVLQPWRAWKCIEGSATSSRNDIFLYCLLRVSSSERECVCVCMSKLATDMEYCEQSRS
jgi:hypothetical protein